MSSKLWKLSEKRGCKHQNYNYLGNRIHIGKCSNQHLHHLIVPIVGREVQWSDALMIPGVNSTLVAEMNFHDIMVATGCCQM